MAQKETIAKTIRLREGYEMVIVEDKQNPLVGRKEVKAKIFHVGKGTPSRWIIRKTIAETYNIPLDVVYVRNVVSEYGKAETTAIIHIYDSPEKARSFEPEHVVQKNKPPEEKKKTG